MNIKKKRQPFDSIRPTHTAMNEKQFRLLISEVKQGVVVPQIAKSPQKSITYSILKRIARRCTHFSSREQKPRLKEFSIYPVRIINEQERTLKTVYLSRTQFREFYAVIQRPVEEVEPTQPGENRKPQKKGKSSK